MTHRCRRLATSVAAAATWLVAMTGATSQTIHFTAVGDSRINAEGAAVLAAAASREPQFHLALGDLSYGRNGEEPEFCDFVTANLGDVPAALITGNHESAGTDGNIDEFVKCLPDPLGGTGTYGRQWYVDLPAEQPIMRMILASPGLRTTDGVKQTYAADTPEYAWLAQTIDGARNAGIRWVVVGAHYPCFSIGVYNCVMGRDTMDLLVQKRVDLVLMGHEHNYTRTHQLGYGPGCETRSHLKPDAALASCIRDADGQMTKDAGTVFAIVGTGGTTLRDIDAADPDQPYFAAASGLNQSPTWGLLDVTVTVRGLRAEFVPAIGTFTDGFTIEDPTAPPDPAPDGDGPPAQDIDPVDPGEFPADPGDPLEDPAESPPQIDSGVQTPASSPGDADDDGIVDTRDQCPLRSGTGDRLGCPTHFVGTPGNDTLRGSIFEDVVLGFPGNDTLLGMGSADRLNGGPGDDTLRGGVGGDTLIGGPGKDQMGGGVGNDTIHARDGARDVVYCGLGKDTAIVDKLDFTNGCERVLRR